MSTFSRFRRFLIGKPIASKHAHHERISNVIALPIFASDALSSVAYASEAIMAALFAHQLLGYTLPISIVIVVLIWIVGTSYKQTIRAYSKGGGSYIVATENIGQKAGMIAAASLLIDYILTVSVSVSAGVLALVSLQPALHPYVVELGVGAVLFITVMNLRGAKESGAVFAVPTYSFVLLVLAVIATAVFKAPPAHPYASQAVVKIEPLVGLGLLFGVLRAFAGGCTALTGIEAISDGVGAFREPVAKNASQTLNWMAALLTVMFLGISFAAGKVGAVPMDLKDGLHLVNGDHLQYKTVLAQIAQADFGDGILFTLVQVFTALILILAANTAYADFPRLASFVARDGFLPRQFGTVGDRLVFKNGVMVLAMVACFLIFIFKGDTDALLPLYAIGVFLSFTLSQWGMVLHAKKENGGKTTAGMLVSGFGAVVTFIVMWILLIEKFKEGAYIVPIVMGILYGLFTMVRRHYDYLAKEMVPHEDETIPATHTTTLLLVPRVHRGVLRAIGYAESTSKDCRALHVTLDPTSTGQIKQDWARYGGDMPLVILESPYRSLVDPVIKYIDQAQQEDPNLIITVIVPQTVPKYWWHAALHNNIAVPLKIALGSRRNVVVTNIRYFLK